MYYWEQIVFLEDPYIMEPYHVYRPIPQKKIDANIDGQINQTPGYAGSESNQQSFSLSPA